MHRKGAISKKRIIGCGYGRRGRITGRGTSELSRLDKKHPEELHKSHLHLHSRKRRLRAQAHEKTEQGGHYHVRGGLSSGELAGLREVREETEEIYYLEAEELVDPP